MIDVQSFQQIPNQIGANHWQLQHPITYPQSVFAVLGPQEAVQSHNEHEKL